MATNYTSIQITDGTTTADLTDGTNYTLAEGGWSPKIARLREAGVGGQSTHEDVVEEIRFSVFASSITTALSKFATIQGLLDQARQFALGESVTPVEIQVEPQGTTSNEWRALVLGGELIAPDDWADNLVNKSIENCVVRVVRRGVWLKTTYSIAYTTTTPGTVYSVSSTNVNTYSPLSWRGYNHPYNAAQEWHPGFLVITNSTTKVQVYTNDAGTSTGTDTADSSCVSGSYDRLQSGQYIKWTPSGFNSSAKRVAIFVSAMGETAGTYPDFTLTMRYLYDSTSSNSVFVTKRITQPGNNRVTFCGVYDYTTALKTIEVARLDADIRINYMCMVQVDDPNTFICDFGTPTEPDSNYAFAMTYDPLQGWGFENNPLTSIAPFAYVHDISQNKMSGNAIGETYLTTYGNIRYAWLAHGQSGTFSPSGTGGGARFEFSYIQASTTLV